MPHLILKTSQLNAVVGGNEAGDAAHPQHRAGYNGLWSLTSVHAPQNCFVPAVAGLNLEHFMDEMFMTEEGGDIFEPRHLPMTLERVSDREARLVHGPSPLTGVSSQTTFTLSEPYFVDLDFRATLHRAPRAGQRFGFFWASYMDAPEAPALHFLDPQGRWASLSADAHGSGNTLCHRSHASASWGAPVRHYRHGSLAHSFSLRRFDLPLMYGRPGDGHMLWLLMLDQEGPVRLCMSPSGGGTCPERSTYNPAWDFQYIADQAQAGQEFRCRARLVYKPYQGRGEILDLYRTWKAHLS